MALEKAQAHTINWKEHIIKVPTQHDCISVKI